MNQIHQFKTHLTRLGFSKTSQQMLPDCLKEFLEFTAKPIPLTTPRDILNYHNYLQERPNKRRPGGLSESYINHHIYSLKLCFAWQQQKGAIIENPISSLNFPRPTSKPREILSQTEIKQLYKVTQTLKERAILSLFYGCGLRRSEGEKLNLKDIHFRTNLLYVREGKNSKRRAVPMSTKVKSDLKKYALQERMPRAKEESFLVNRNGTRTAHGHNNLILKNILNRASIKKEITLHCLRHSIATHLLESGLSVESVRDFLGHKYLESTQVYTRVNNQQLWSLRSI